MGYSWSALLLCGSLLLSLSIIPISCAGDDVSFKQANSAKGPFDVDSTVIYEIPVNNNINYNMLYTVELEVGSDKNYPYIYKKYAKQEINVGPHSTVYAAFDVNFRASEICKGDFARWASDKNDTSIWENAWYSAVITPLSGGRQKTLQNYAGVPQLTKPIFKFEKASVTPTLGSNKDIYSYDVTAFGSYGDNISLQVAPSQEGPWTDLGSRDYTTPNAPQTLKWDNKTLSFDFTRAYYKFSGRKSSKVFEGPSWPVDVEYRNISVTPMNGTPDTSFTYSVDLNASKAIEVELNVWDVSSRSYNSFGRFSYRNASRWETLTWSGIKPSLATDASGQSNYFFSFYYEGAESPIITTYQQIGKYYPGPSLAPVALKDWTVEPGNGTIFTPYAYSVQVESREPSFDVKLQTSPPGCGMWTDKGTVTYNGDANNMLVWENISFDPSFADIVGRGKYRFVVGDTVLGEFEGPNIDVAFKNVTYISLPNTARFDYSVMVKSLESNLSIELTYTNDGLTWTRSNLVQEYKSNSQEWKELVWENQPWHKTVRFDVVRT